MSYFKAQSLFVEGVLKDAKTYEKDYEWMREEVAHSEAYYKGRPVAFLYNPRLVTKRELADFERIIEKSNAIFSKVIARYSSDPKYREAFGFPKEMEELILLPTPLKWPIPMARYDIFYRGEGDFIFCEINTDGSSAMNEDRVFTEIFSRSKGSALIEPMKPFAFELFHSWVEAVKEHFPPGALRRVAIVDIGEWEENAEFIRFREAFREAGIACELARPEDLTFDGQWLRQGTEQVDAVYRRLVTADFFAHSEQTAHLAEAMKSGKTVWIGPIKTQIIHNKRIFHVLHRKEFQEMFTSEEQQFIRAHVPFTAELRQEMLGEELFLQKDDYLLKPPDAYAAKGVLSGRACTPEEWKRALEEAADTGILLQRFADVPAFECVDFEVQGSKALYHHITGLFVYNGKLAGVYSRASRGEMIADQFGGKTLPTYGIDYEA